MPFPPVYSKLTYSVQRIKCIEPTRIKASRYLCATAVYGESAMKKLLRPLFFITFGIYCFILLSLLLLNRASLYTRDFTEYAQNSVNLIPFQTLMELFRRHAEQSINTDIVFDNAVGNFLLFFPMGVYLPCMDQNTRKLPRLLLTVFLIVLLLETLQLVFRVGSFDVDDILLNVAGAAAGFGIWRIEKVQRMLKAMQWLR